MYPFASLLFSYFVAGCFHKNMYHVCVTVLMYHLPVLLVLGIVSLLPCTANKRLYRLSHLLPPECTLQNSRVIILFMSKEPPPVALLPKLGLDLRSCPFLSVKPVFLRIQTYKRTFNEVRIIIIVTSVMLVRSNFSHKSNFINERENKATG